MLEAQELLYFLREAGEPLNLTFVKQPYSLELLSTTH